MELLKAFVWLWVGWAATSFARRETLPLSPSSQPTSPPLPHVVPKPLRTRLLEQTPILPDEAVKQRLATLCLREGKSLIYIAVCPWHTPTADVNSTGKCFTWDVETGMAHCFWCGWGGRVARPLTGPVHPDLLPATFRLVLVT